MEGRQHLRNMINAISIENQEIGVYLDGDDGAKFRIFPQNMSDPVFPTRQKTPDTMVGTGRAYPKKGKATRFDPVNLAYDGALTSTMGVRIVRLAQGGTITETPNVTPETIDSKIKMLPAGSKPMVANVIKGRFLVGDVYVQSYEVTQQADGEPQLRASLSNGGHHAKVADTDIDTADIEEMADYFKYAGAKTKLTFSDGVTSYDYASEGRLIDVSISVQQNVQVENLPNDPPQNASAECQGTYTKNLTIDVQSVKITAKVYMDETFDIFDSWLPDKTLTSVKLKFMTCETIGATTHKAQIEFEIPLSEFNLVPTQNNNYEAFTFDIMGIEGDPVTGCLMFVTIRQETSVDEEL